MSNRLPPGHFERLLESGELARVAARCTSNVEFAAALGVSLDSLLSARRRATLAGKRWPELGAGDGYLNLPNRQVEVDDFAEEERTQPGISFDHIEPALMGGRPWQTSDFRNPEALPYEPPPVPMTRRLTKEECPDGTLMLWMSDVHIPIHNEPVCRLIVECAERAGVSQVTIGGDGLDFNCLSKHAKESHRTVSHATILEEVEPGRWLMNWWASKRSRWVLGNHEDRLKRFVDENPAFHGSVVGNFAQVVNLPSGIEVIPQAGRIQVGNLTLCHLDAEFKNSSGGKNPAQRVLEMLPDHSTIGGHFHRICQARRTTIDEYGIKRTRCAWIVGHLSHEHLHYGYVSTTPNWQTGFGLIRFWWEDDRPRWSVYQIEVLFDRHNRPYFEFEGRLYR